MDCRNVRNEIQNHLDGEASLSVEAEEHLSECAGCREMLETYRAYTDGLAKALDAETRQLGQPDFSFLRRKRRDRRILIWAGAALVAVAIAAPFAYRGYTASRTRAYIRDDNSRFIDTLLSSKLLETGNGFLADSAWSADTSWFDGTEGISDMLQGSPLF
jgi:predicted anti-sigma-YlaC factor YlaD